MYNSSESEYLPSSDDSDYQADLEEGMELSRQAKKGYYKKNGESSKGPK